LLLASAALRLPFILDLGDDPLFPVNDHTDAAVIVLDPAARDVVGAGALTETVEERLFGAVGGIDEPQGLRNVHSRLDPLGLFARPGLKDGETDEADKGEASQDQNAGIDVQAVEKTHLLRAGRSGGGAGRPARGSTGCRPDGGQEGITQYAAARGA
jgi:hypothetical protein